jgi:hypothetical protein
MARKSSRLPSRFPVGTKFVIEGRRAGEGEVQVFKRYIEFPDGTFLRLPTRLNKSRPAPATRPARRSRSVAAKPGPQAGGRA